MTDTPFHSFVRSFSLPFELVEDLARDKDDGTPGWAVLLDIDLCPWWALGWLAQFRGVALPPRLLSQSAEDYWAEMREWIKRADGKNRGSVAAIDQAARRRLIGPDGTSATATVTISERDGGDAYQLVVSTLDAETPDPVGTLADILSQKPAGLVLNHQASETITWGELRANFATWGDVLAAYSTWDEVRLNLP